MKNRKEAEKKTAHDPRYMCIGLSLGMAVGAAFDNIPIGMVIGLGFGAAVGMALSRKKGADAGAEDCGEEREA